MPIIDPKTFHPYQEDTASIIVQKKRVPLLAPMGSGKTLMTLGALDRAGVVGNTPIVIVAPKMALAQWQDEIAKWLGISNEGCPVAVGNPMMRKVLWHDWERGDYPFILTNYHSIMRDKSFLPKAPPIVVGDEGHKMRNRQTETFKSFKTFTLHSDNLIIPTGTWARKGPQNLWTLMHMANRKTFSSYWKFVKSWCHVEHTPFGQEIIGPKNTEQFKVMLQRYAAFVSDEVVEPYLPKKQRIIAPVDMSPLEERLYNELSTGISILDNGNLLVAPTSLAKIVRFRQLLVTPKLLDPNAEYGSGLEFISNKVEDHDNKHFVIFTPFAKALPFVKGYIEKTCKVRCITMRGGEMSIPEMRARVKQFKEEGCAIAISVHYAESYDLETANLCFMLGFDFSHDVNKQAEDRLRRASSDHERCTYYYIKHRNTYEEDIFQNVDLQHRNVESITPRMIRGRR